MIEDDVADGQTPGWRTSDVVSFADQIFFSRDFSTTSILADLLEDAGLRDEEVLGFLRTPVYVDGTTLTGYTRTYGYQSQLYRILAFIRSRETAEAMQTVERIAEMAQKHADSQGGYYDDDEDDPHYDNPREIHVDGREMLERGLLYTHNGAYWNAGPTWESIQLPWEEFWKAFDIVTGTEKEEDEEDEEERQWGFFTCAC